LQLAQSWQNHPKTSLLLAQKLCQQKDIQIYSRDEQIANILQKKNLTGRMFNPQELYYFLIESNVGINKANRLVNRQVQIKIGEKQEKIVITWQNNNTIPYVNYQRLYTNPQTEIINLSINDKKSTLVDQNIFLTREKQMFKEFGFLISVLAGQEAKVEIDLKNPLSLESKKKLFIQKQSGLPKTQYIVTYQDQIRYFELTSDQNLVFD
jgi:hypothetical protein